MSDAHPWNDGQWWSGTSAPLREATGLPPEAYTSAAFFADEQRRVFERGWIVVGTANEVAVPGHMLVRRVASRSVIITRDPTGPLRAFFNACRHRGTELAEADCDVAGTIRCPYHRWGYGLDGALLSTPRFDEVPRTSFDRADFGLVPVRAQTWGPLLFVCLDPQTEPLEIWLGDLPDRLSGYDLQAWTEHEHRTLTIDANWKLISENFMECYHLTWIHPELSKVSRVKDHYRYQGAGMYCGQTTSPVSGDDRNDWLVLPPAPDLDESDGASGRFIALFPNVLLSVLPNHALLMRLEPVAPGRTIEHCTFLLPSANGGVAESEFAATRAFWFGVNDQDIAIVERGQRGLAHGALPPGPLAPRFEEPLHRFHNMLLGVMTSSTLAGLEPPRGDPDTDDARLGTGPNPLPPAINRPA